MYADGIYMKIYYSTNKHTLYVSSGKYMHGGGRCYALNVRSKYHYTMFW